MIAALVVGAVVTGACGGGKSSGPSAPSPPASVDLTGTWSGTATDSSGPGQMSWQLTQTAAGFTGTMIVSDAAGTRLGRGSVSGTVFGSAIQFSAAVPAGGFEGNAAPCSATVSGSASATATTITGSYSGTQSCSGAIGAGSLTLSRQ